MTNIGYNDHIIRTSADLSTTDRILGQFVAKCDRSENFILAHYNRPEEQQLQLDFRKGLESFGTDSLPNLQVVDLEEGTYEDLRKALIPEIPNHIIVLTNNEASVSKLMRSMIGWLEDYEIILYSGDSWAKFKNIDVAYFDQLRHHRPEVSFIDHDDQLVVNFNMLFRESFGTEPGSFAFKGYDIGLQLLSQLKVIQNESVQSLSGLPVRKGLQQDFSWRQNSKGHWLNNATYIVRLNDLRLEEVR